MRPPCFLQYVELLYDLLGVDDRAQRVVSPSSVETNRPLHPGLVGLVLLELALESLNGSGAVSGRSGICVLATNSGRKDNVALLRCLWCETMCERAWSSPTRLAEARARRKTIFLVRFYKNQGDISSRNQFVSVDG